MLVHEKLRVRDVPQLMDDVYSNQLKPVASRPDRIRTWLGSIRLGLDPIGGVAGGDPGRRQPCTKAVQRAVTALALRQALGRLRRARARRPRQRSGAASACQPGTARP